MAWGWKRGCRAAENTARSSNGQVVDPQGNYVGALGSSEHEEVLIRDLDLDLIQTVRDNWQFYRDRRPDSYTAVVKP